MGIEQLISLLDIFVNVVVAIITFVLGFLVSRFTMSKKKKKDHKAMLQESSNRMSQEIASKFGEFTFALKKYIDRKGKPKFEDFYDIATKGEIYFAQVRALCDSIISSNIDKQSIKNTHFPLVKELVENVLPEYYETLKDISQKRDFEFDGELKRENYESIYKVYEKYS